MPNLIKELWQEAKEEPLDAAVVCGILLGCLAGTIIALTYLVALFGMPLVLGIVIGWSLRGGWNRKGE